MEKFNGWLLKDGTFLFNNSFCGHICTAYKYIENAFPEDWEFYKFNEMPTDKTYDFMFNKEAIRVVSGFSFEFNKDFLSESTLNRIKDFVYKNNIIAKFIYIDTGNIDIKIPIEEIENNGIWNAYIKERRIRRISSKTIEKIAHSNKFGWILKSGEFISNSSSWMGLHAESGKKYLESINYKFDDYFDIWNIMTKEFDAIKVSRNEFDIQNINNEKLLRIQNFITDNLYGNYEKVIIYTDSGDFYLEAGKIYENGILEEYKRQLILNRRKNSKKLTNILKISNIKNLKKYFYF